MFKNTIKNNLIKLAATFEGKQVLPLPKIYNVDGSNPSLWNRFWANAQLGHNLNTGDNGAFLTGPKGSNFADFMRAKDMSNYRLNPMAATNASRLRQLKSLGVTSAAVGGGIGLGLAAGTGLANAFGFDEENHGSARRAIQGMAGAGGGMLALPVGAAISGKYLSGASDVQRHSLANLMQINALKGGKPLANKIVPISKTLIQYLK